MLEVLNPGSAELPHTGGNRGMLLNCWNKSSPLIKELERTVNFAERKCGDLMQELHFYKEYYEKWAQFERVNQSCQKKKVKKYCRQTPDFGSSSENELEKANEYLCKKIKNKINEVSLASRKIVSKSQSPSEKRNLAPNEESLGEGTEGLSLAIEKKTCKSEPTMTSCRLADRDSGGVKVTGKQSSKSVPLRKRTLKLGKKDFDGCRRRCGNLQRFKIRSKSLPQGVRRKFGFGGFFEVFEPDAIGSRSSSKADVAKSCKSWKSKTRSSETRKPTPESSSRFLLKSKSDVRLRSRTPKCHQSRYPKNDGPRRSPPEDVNLWKAVVPSPEAPPAPDAELSLRENLRNLIAKPNSFLPFLRHPIPFIPCSSTSRSFNLGLNVQQVLSLIKHKRHSVTLQAVVKNGMQAARTVTEPVVNTLFISQTTTSRSRVTSAICPAREGSEDAFSVFADARSRCSILKRVQTMRSRIADEKPTTPWEPATEVRKLERPEDVWAVEQPDAAPRELAPSRSKCTCFPSRHCVDYNKVLRQYTGWKPLLPPSEFCVAPSSFDACGVESAADPAKVRNHLLLLTRKCSKLQKEISQNRLDEYEANAVLGAMESELALREVEYKDVLNVYNQLMMLKEKVRSLRSRMEGRQSGFQGPKRNPLEPTPSMALAKVLKNIQGLQDKIKMIDAP